MYRAISCNDVPLLTAVSSIHCPKADDLSRFPLALSACDIPTLRSVLSEGTLPSGKRVPWGFIEANTG